MRIVNRKRETITQFDLTAGRLVPVKVIREGAEPIDNVKKFAWAESDYEDAKMYIPNPQNTASEPTEQEKMKAFIAALEVPQKPDQPAKLGYKWELKYKFGDSGFKWEQVQDPTARGTRTNPIKWEDGATVKRGYHFTDGKKIYRAIADGVTNGLTDVEHIEEVTE